jgi:hypothetical protein
MALIRKKLVLLFFYSIALIKEKLVGIESTEILELIEREEISNEIEDTSNRMGVKIFTEDKERALATDILSDI